MENKEVASILTSIGNILDIKGENPFKVRAYYTAAKNIEALSEPIEKLAKENRLNQISGIGEGISEKVNEYIKTGKIKYYEEIKKDISNDIIEMLKIPFLGPKKVKLLYDKMGIKNIQELENACHKNKLLELEGFGEKTQKKILEGIEFLSKHKDRYLLSDAIPAAEELLNSLRKCSVIQRISLAGSIRRWKETVKDIDIVASSNQPEKLMDYFTKLPSVEIIMAKGETKSSVRLKTGIASDLRVVKDSEFPYALCHFTGSKEHNIAMRLRANSMGIKINEYGIFTQKDDKLISVKDEKEFFKVLRLDFILPELRENTGEIEAAEKGILPLLLADKDIKGIFHCHTNWSDGNATIEKMVEASKNLGYHYLGIAEHSKSAFYAGGLNEEKLKKQIQYIDKLNKRNQDFLILKGIEVDILNNGELDFSDDILSQLDFVICAIHSKFTMSEEEMTKRIIKAITNPNVDILAHPTGRLLLNREGYKVNLTKIIETAKKYNKIIELNCHPQRLDMDWINLKHAKEMGVKIAIGPDAHNIRGIEDMKYGVKTARRGWLEAKDVINTISSKEILKFFNHRQEK